MIPNRRLERSDRRVRTSFSLLVTALSILSGVLGGLILVNTALSGAHHGRSGGTGLVPAAVKFGNSKAVPCSALACSTTGYTVKAYSTLLIMFAASSSTAPSAPIVRHPKVTPSLVTDVANSPVENYVWYVPNITASTTVAVYSNFSASQANGFMLADVQNVTTSPLACSGVGTGTSMTESASCSSTNPNTVSILATGFEAATSPTQAAASGGDTALVATTIGPTSSQYVSYSSFYQVQSTSGSHTLSATTATSRTWAAIMFALGAAAVPNAPTSFAHGTLTETTLPTTWSYSPSIQPIVNDTLKLATYSGGSCGTYGSIVSTGGRAKSYTYSGLTPGGAYCVEVFAWNSTGESSAASLTDVVLPANPSISFVVSPTSPDVGHAATFTSTVTGGVSPFTYAWTFGCHLGGTSTAANPSYTYTASGSCVVWVNVTDAASVKAGSHQTIVVNADPTVTFVVSPTSPDEGSPATFTSTVSNGASPYTYAWTFGCHLGGTSTAANPSYTYTTSGSCVVWLNVTDADGVVAPYHLTITVNPTLTVSWTVAPTSPDQGSAATFTSTVSGGKTPYTYAWTFGCHLGGTSTAADPSYTYTASGSCVVWLNVTDSDSVTVAYHQTITVNAPLSVSWTVAPTSPDQGSAATFTSTVSGGETPYTYAWTFGCHLGGTSTAADPSYTYTASGSCVVWLNVTDADSITVAYHQTITVNAPLSVSWVVSPASPDVGRAATFTSTVSGGKTSYTYAWTFGCHLGGTSTAANPSYTYTTSGSCVVWLNVTDADSITVAYHLTITVNGAPSVAWTAVPSSGEEGVSIAFTSHVSGGTSPFTYAWTFGCSSGGTSTAANPSYTYSVSGTCAVWVNVTDADSVVATYHASYSVATHLTIVSIGWSPTIPDVGSTTTFSGVVTGGVTPFGSSSYQWSLGGGVHQSGGPSFVPSRTYATAGTYVIWLNVTDAIGVVAMYHADLTVNNTPTVSFAWAPTTPDVGVTTTFTSTVTPGAPPYTYAWTFGDHGGTSALADPAHVFLHAGLWAVWLNVTDAQGEIATYHATITVVADPSVTWTAVPPAPDQGSPVVFTAHITGGTGPFVYAWSFGGGAGYSAAASPTATYGSFGTFQAWINVTDSEGEVASYHAFIDVNPTLTVSFVVSPSSPEVGIAAHFTSTVTGGQTPYTYAWTFGCGLGGTSTAANPHYTYPAVGSCVVWLNVTDADSVTVGYHLTVTIVQALGCSFTVGPRPIRVGASELFTGTAFYGTAPYTYSWAFGDATTGSGQLVSHSYLAVGNYTVVLTVVDAGNVTASCSLPITVQAAQNNLGAPWAPWLVALAIASGFFVLFFIVAGRRRRKQPPHHHRPRPEMPAWSGGPQR